MQLQKFLKDNGIEPTTFAETLGLKGKATIYRYLRHENVPRKQVLEKISKATGGQVTAADFYTEVLS